MKQHNQRFEDHIERRVSGSLNQRVKDRQGIVLSYNPLRNTATVGLSGQDSDQITDIIKDVPCPALLGVQMAAPEPGRLCWVVFKGGRESQPLITHFYNHEYQKFDYSRQSRAASALPSYMLR